MKNTVSINKARTLTVGKVAGVVVLAAFAIAFFALPLTSFAMKGKCGKTAVTNGLFMSILTSSTDSTLSATPTSTNLLSFAVDPNQASTLSVGEWIQVKDPKSGKVLFGTILDTKGSVLLTNSAKFQLTGTFPQISQKPVILAGSAPTNALLSSTGW